MDALSYTLLKSKGLVTLSKNPGGQSILATVTVFDQFGTTSVQTQTITLADIQAQRAAIQAQVASLNTLVTDIQALP